MNESEVAKALALQQQTIEVMQRTIDTQQAMLDGLAGNLAALIEQTNQLANTVLAMRTREFRAEGHLPTLVPDDGDDPS